MNSSQLIEAARAALLDDIVGFIAERNITETTFGRLAVNDGKFVARLRDPSKTMTTGLIHRTLDFIHAERAKRAPSPPPTTTEPERTGEAA